MPGANRIRGGGRDGGVLHITHRCHNREYLLKFAKDRDAYRERLREHAKKFRLWLLDYCITSNHTHLLIDASDRLEASAFMREVASESARAYPDFRNWRVYECASG